MTRVSKLKIHTVNGFTGTLSEVAEHFGIKYNTLKDRMLRKGMTLDEAVNYEGQWKKYTVDGFTGTIPQIAKHFGISYQTFKDRMRKGMTVEEAVNYEGQWKKYTIDGFTGTLNEIADHFGIGYSALIQRMRKGMTIEEAVNVPLEYVRTKNLDWKGKKIDLKDICKLEGKDLESVYELLKSNHTLEWAVEYAEDIKE